LPATSRFCWNFAFRNSENGSFENERKPERTQGMEALRMKGSPEELREWKL